MTPRVAEVANKGSVMGKSGGFVDKSCVAEVLGRATDKHGSVERVEPNCDGEICELTGGLDDPRSINREPADELHRPRMAL